MIGKKTKNPTAILKREYVSQWRKYPCLFLMCTLHKTNNETIILDYKNIQAGKFDCKALPVF